MCCTLYYFSKTTNRLMMIASLVISLLGGIVSIYCGYKSGNDALMKFYSSWLEQDLAYMSYLIGIIVGSFAIFMSLFGIMLASPI